jgi:hypothetical protein
MIRTNGIVNHMAVGIDDRSDYRERRDLKLHRTPRASSFAHAVNRKRCYVPGTSISTVLTLSAVHVSIKRRPWSTIFGNPVFLPASTTLTSMEGLLRPPVEIRPMRISAAVPDPFSIQLITA